MKTLTQPASTAPSGAKGISLSQNETESLCMKAARGVGFSWGLAEEAGVAVGWLCIHGIDCTAQFLSLLTDRLSDPSTCGRPVPTPGNWRGDSERMLCPIATGAALLDSALLGDGPVKRTTEIASVSMPILLLPFLARAAKVCAQPLEVAWPGGNLRIASNGSIDGQSLLGWVVLDETGMTLRSPSEPIPFGAGKFDLPILSPDVVDGLNMFALRTTVPATDTSRRGAGSTSTDND